jgi:voltage-gated potassium channel
MSSKKCIILCLSEMNLFTNISKEIRSRLIYASLAIFSAVFFGAIVFKTIEGISFLDAVYLTTQTVTTVGYGDVSVKSDAGKLFAVVFMLIGAGTVLYALTVVAQAIVQTEVLSALGTRRKSKEMEKLNNHFIVCGAGRVGRRIISQLQKQKVQFIVIERDEKRLEQLVTNKDFIVIGDATSESVLHKAGVERAKGLASCLPDDADNVYVVLTARGMNDKLHIVARAVEEEAEPKLIRAGASRVVAPTIIGSHSMARALLKPAVADFMDSIVAETLDLAFEEVSVESTSKLVGKRLTETNIRAELDLVIVAIRRKNGEMIFHPSGETVINEADLLVSIGKAESMQQLVNLCK